jgi:uncharacterized RDD family membrane protein YckC
MADPDGGRSAAPGDRHPLATDGPDGDDSQPAPAERRSSERRSNERRSSEPAAPAPAERFGAAGWGLVAVLVLAFFVVPGALLYLPAAQGVVESLGLSLRDAYLTLPLIPAFLLGAAAVWVALRSRRS